MNVPIDTISPESTESVERVGVAQVVRSRLRIGLGLDRFSGIYILGALILLYGLWIPDLFLTSNNFKVVASGEAVTAILAFGLLIPLAAGAFDLSVAANMGLAVVVVLWMQNHGYNALLACVVAVLVSAVVGGLNAIIVIGLKVDSFVATLGMSSVLAAAAFWVTKGQQITTGISPTFLTFGTGEWLDIPIPVYCMLGVGLVLWFFLEFRPAGRYLYAVGGNPNAARLAGVRTNRLVGCALVAGGTLAGFAGVVLAAELGTGTPDAGPPYLLPAFTAVFLGATQIKRARANVLGTLIAIYLLAIGIKGLQLVGAPVYVNDLFNGLALIIAVALAVRTRRGVKQAS